MIDYNVSDVIEIIRREVPEAVQEEWDNSGIQILFGNSKVNKILTCLDVTEAVAREAVDAGVQLIVSHHPVLFGGVKSIEDRDFKGRIIQTLIKNEISVYSAHTSFDKAEKGNNRVVAELLQLTDIHCPESTDICMIGNIPVDMPVRLADFAEYVSQKLETKGKDSVRFAGNPDKLVRTAGICTGSGSEFAGLLKEAGCHVLITGDVRYHEALDAVSEDFAIIDAGHFGTERFFPGAMMRILRDQLRDCVEIISSQKEKNPFTQVY